MKKLTIGRNNACDIVIPDTSDLVSRKQAILTYSFWGKMVLYDTSNNGTYVNGVKLENGKGISVTRKDKVNFARIADLDWNEVKNPYRKTWLLSALCAAILFIVSVLLVLWLIFSDNGKESTPADTDTPTEMGETYTTVKSEVVEEQPTPKPSSRPKKKIGDKKRKSVTTDDIINREVNESSPIVY